MSEQVSKDPMSIQLGEGRVIIGAREADGSFELYFAQADNALEIGEHVSSDMKIDPFCVVRFKGPKDLAVLEGMVKRIKERMEPKRFGAWTWEYVCTHTGVTSR